MGTITEGPDATVATSADAAAVDNEWALWPVPPAHPSDYSATADVVTDNVTGLIWQQVVPNGTFTWERAKSYCEGLELGGYSSGWRLPTTVELISLVDYTAIIPAINASFFPNTPWQLPNCFWAATPYAGGQGAWGVEFNTGAANFYDGTGEEWVRCVRGGKAPSAPHYSVATDTVTDNWTGLTWQRAVPAQTYDWADAATYCSGLSLAGLTGWRLPFTRELETLVDKRARSPAIDSSAFPDTPAEYCWASTSYGIETTWAWGVEFRFGGSGAYGIPNLLYVRCVR